MAASATIRAEPLVRMLPPPRPPPPCRAHEGASVESLGPPWQVPPAVRPRGAVSMKRIGVLTGGGDCPGLNGAIRAVVRSAIGGMGWEVVGFRNGCRGAMDRDVLELSTEAVRRILHRGGTILGS